jgi:hypothetical protein
MHYRALIKQCSNKDLIYAYQGAISALESIKLEIKRSELMNLPIYKMN